MTSDFPVEHVLVVPTSLFHEIGHFQGFCPDIENYLERLLHPAQMSFRPRDTVEEDPSLKQLIPYCVFRHEGRVFHYRRGTEQGEGRLHSKRSIGIGGHISSEDTQAGRSPYEEGMQREIAEEVFLETGYTEQCVGLINDDLTEVGQVHLGVVHVFDLDEPKVRPREESIIETGFATPGDLVDDRESFETWSQICLDHLLGESDSGSG
ncbi:MAG: phosphoesterase [Planctomycetaceae bacterium]|nr:phosphoesterase [Planctomycetaceae bacterium]|tara:strand:+ start:1743 stop:2366 length:624 start_codon:yes stop_codon:yes gene_type:complete